MKGLLKLLLFNIQKEALRQVAKKVVITIIAGVVIAAGTTKNLMDGDGDG